MGEFLDDEKRVREYLLGRVSDEATLEEIEELLFTDEEFCSRIALAEDDIINDYVFGRLDEADAASFRATLDGNPERRLKLGVTEALRKKALAENATAAERVRSLAPELAPSPAAESAPSPASQRGPAPSAEGATAAADRPSFFTSLVTFFRGPKYAGAFAVLLVALLAAAVYLVRGGRPDGLAELREVYSRERPTETRISEFAYAPLAQLRGAPEPRERNRLRRIENSFIEATEKSPGAQTHHSLGVFYLTQQEYPDAIRELEAALKFSDKNAGTHNDLGAAYFELAKTSPPERRLEHLSRALEEFTAATELDGNLLEALFNKSLALQELRLPRQAKESWTLYLQKDPSSPWAEEARRNLARVNDEHARARTDEEVLRDFLNAFRNRDEARALKIHDETKGLLKAVTVPLQLSRRLLAARLRGDEAEAKESADAMAFIGDSERSRHADFFFLNWPASTPAQGPIRPKGSCVPRSFSTTGSASYSKAATTA